MTTSTTATLMNIAHTANLFAGKVKVGKRFFGPRKIADKLYKEEEQYKQVFITVYLSAIDHKDVIIDTNTWLIKRVDHK